MAHRKIIYLQVKVVLDINNDEFPDKVQHSMEYNQALEDAIEDFAQETDYSIGNTEDATVVSSELISWKTEL